MSSVPAIINAIYDAVGVALKRIPATPDMILEAKKTRHKKKQKMSLPHFEYVAPKTVTEAIAVKNESFSALPGEWITR